MTRLVEKNASSVQIDPDRAKTRRSESKNPYSAVSNTSPDVDQALDTVIRFPELPVVVRVRVLKALCDYHLYVTSRTCKFLREVDEDDLRVEPLGSYHGSRFFYFPQFWMDCRLYRLHGSGSSCWELVCSGLEELSSFTEYLKPAKSKELQSLRSDLENVLDDMRVEREKLEKQKAREEKLAKLMAMPRRQSRRVARLQEDAAVRRREEIALEEQRRLEELERRRIQVR